MRRLGIQWQWNLRARRVEYQRKQSGWLPLSDREESGMRLEAAKVCSIVRGKSEKPWKPGRPDWELMMQADLAGKEYDPFISWVEGLPKWDGKRRLDSLLTDVFSGVGDTDPEITEWVSRYLIVGALQRAYEPGCELREIPVLIGPQKSGKSTWARSMIPPEMLFDWFGDALDLAAKGKEQAEAMAGRVVVEISELAGIGKAEIERLKAFLTRLDDGQHRGAYARNAEQSPRRCVLIGTTNDTLCLPNDTTGNTRFVPQVVGQAHGPIPALLKEAGGIEQLWAEGLARYREGLRANLPWEWSDRQKTLTDAHGYVNRLALDAVDDLPTDRPLSLATIAELSPAVRNRASLIPALNLRGWVNKHTWQDSTTRRRLWHPPGMEDAPTEEEF